MGCWAETSLGRRGGDLRRYPGGAEYFSILLTVSRCSPNTRAASRVLIPSTMQARRTRAYISTLYILHTFHRVAHNSMEGGGRYGITAPHLYAVTRLHGPLLLRRLQFELLSPITTADAYGRYSNLRDVARQPFDGPGSLDSRSVNPMGEGASGKLYSDVNLDLLPSSSRCVWSRSAGETLSQSLRIERLWRLY